MRKTKVCDVLSGGVLLPGRRRVGSPLRRVFAKEQG
jgi:hypothetical protein